MHASAGFIRSGSITAREIVKYRIQELNFTELNYFRHGDCHPGFCHVFLVQQYYRQHTQLYNTLQHLARQCGLPLYG